MGSQVNIPEGDVLIHCGDLTSRGTDSEVESELRWMASLPHQHKLFVAGNHDWFFYPDAPVYFRNWSLIRHQTVPEMLAKFPSLTYLEDSGVEIDGLKFYGSPWQPPFCDWAFNLKPGQAEEVWAKIPDDTHVLITHTPPWGSLDVGNDGRLGCPVLTGQLPRLKHLGLHVFGHIHEGYGVERRGSTVFANCAVNNRDYQPVNAPIVVELSRAMEMETV